MSTIATPNGPAGMITPPPAIMGPKPWKWTREQYFKFGELGYFGDRRVQLIFGEIIEMPRQNWPHVAGCRKVADRLRAAFVGLGWVSEKSPLPFADSAPEPDVAVIPGRFEDYTDHPTTALLIVEVSDTTFAYDTTMKAELYATAAVPEYWVLDVTGRQLVVFRDPQPLAAALGAITYRSQITLSPADSVSPLHAANVTLTVADLLP